MAVSFKTWNTSFQDLLAFKASIDKSAAVLMCLTLYVTWCFSLTTFGILPLFSIFIILIINMTRGGSLQVLYVCCPKHLLNIDCYPFRTTGNFELWIFWKCFYAFRMRFLPSLLTVSRYNMNILKSPPVASHYSSLFLLTSLLAPSPHL